MDPCVGNHPSRVQEMLQGPIEQSLLEHLGGNLLSANTVTPTLHSTSQLCYSVLAYL